MLNKVNDFLVNLSTLKFIITITVIIFSCSFVLGVFFDILGITFSGTDSYISHASLGVQFIFAVIISPVLETLLFQNCVIKFLRM